jgi:hypothetical protein
MSKIYDPYHKILRDILPDSNNIQPMSKKSKKMFTSILNRLREGDKSWTHNRDDIVSLGIEYREMSDFIGRGSYNHIPTEIRNTIEQIHVYQAVYSFNINKRVFRVALMLPVKSKSSRKPTAFFQDVIKKMYIWLYLIAPAVKPDCSDTMNIHIFFTDHKKRLAQVDQTPLGEIHVNTAFTTSCKPSTDVHIYRKEEWFKVFIHETFHSQGLDFSSMNDSSSDRIILKHFPITTSRGVRLYESYCEMWAEIMQNVFIAYFTSSPKDIDSKLLSKIEKLLHKETLFSIFQCVKILNHYNLTYEQLTDIDCPMSKKVRQNYHEESHILSYYVIKSILFSQYNKFIEWCGENNIEDKSYLPYTINTIRFLHTPEAIEKYTRLAVNESQNEYLLKNIRHFENILPTLPTNHEIIDTLRMSVHELK